MPERLRDTHPDADRIQVEGLRSMPVWRKLQIVSDLTVATQSFALAGLRQRFPNAGPAELHRRLATLTLGPELASRVYGPETVPSTKS